MSGSRWKFCFSGIVEALKSILTWCITIPVLLLLCPLYIYKYCVLLFAKICHPDLRPVSAVEAPFVAEKIAEDDKVKFEYERRPLNNIGAYFEVDQGILDLDKLTSKVQKSLLEKQTDWNWRFKSYVVRFGGYSFWKENPNFNISDHVQTQSLPNGNNICDFLNVWITKPYAPRQPLWELLIVKGTSNEYIAFKCHHAMGDGLSVCEVFSAIFEFGHHAKVQQIIQSPQPRISFLEMLTVIIRTPSLYLDHVLKFSKSTDPFQIQAGIEVEQLISTHTMSLSAAKLISKQQGVSFMSVLLTIFGGSIHRYLLHCGKPIPDYFFIPIPQPWPGRPKHFIGNQWNMIFASVPLNILDPLERLSRVQKEISENYSTKMFLVYKYMVLNFWTLIPTKLVAYFTNRVRVRYTLSPLLVADEGVFDGKPVTMKSATGLAGIFTPTLGMVGLALSIKDNLTWTIIGAKDLFKTQENLNILTKQYIQEALEELQLACNNSDLVIVKNS